MNAFQVLGGAMVGAVVAFLFGGVAWAGGWRMALGVWASALALAAILIVGIFMVKGVWP